MVLKLSDKECAMRNGDFGPAQQWAINHQIQVGSFFDAIDMVPVSQAHMMADPESVGEAGVAFIEGLASHNTKVMIPMITDPRGVDLAYYQPLGQTEEMASLERRFIAACEAIGIMMTNTCINYQTIMPPVRGDHLAFGDTGVVIYANSVCGARSNFEGGPSALAAGLTGRTPRYGLHLDSYRRATRRFRVTIQPNNLTDWGILGAVIGKKSGTYWEVPVIEGIESSPTSDEVKHFGAAMASYGSTPLFHLVGITPEAQNLDDCGGDKCRPETITAGDISQLGGGFIRTLPRAPLLPSSGCFRRMLRLLSPVSHPAACRARAHYYELNTADQEHCVRRPCVLACPQGPIVRMLGRRRVEALGKSWRERTERGEQSEAEHHDADGYATTIEP